MSALFGGTKAVASRRTEAKVAELLGEFPLLPEIPALFAEWLRLVSRHGLIGRQVRDARLAALLNIHGTARLLTYFDNVEEIQDGFRKDEERARWAEENLPSRIPPK